MARRASFLRFHGQKPHDEAVAGLRIEYFKYPSFGRGCLVSGDISRWPSMKGERSFKLHVADQVLFAPADKVVDQLACFLRGHERDFDHGRRLYAADTTTRHWVSRDVGTHVFLSKCGNRWKVRLNRLYPDSMLTTHSVSPSPRSLERLSPYRAP